MLDLAGLAEQVDKLFPAPTCNGGSVVIAASPPSPAFSGRPAKCRVPQPHIEPPVTCAALDHPAPCPNDGTCWPSNHPCRFRARSVSIGAAATDEQPEAEPDQIGGSAGSPGPYRCCARCKGMNLPLSWPGVAGFEPAASSSRSQVPVRPLEVDSGSGHIGRAMGPIGSLLLVLPSSQDAPEHNARWRAPDPSGLPSKPVTGGSADGLPIAQAYATRAGIAFTVA
jgi:hypothetical protein